MQQYEASVYDVTGADIRTGQGKQLAAYCCLSFMPPAAQAAPSSMLSGENVVTTRRLGTETDAAQCATTQHSVQPLKTALIVKLIH